MPTFSGIKAFECFNDKVSTKLCTLEEKGSEAIARCATCNQRTEFHDPITFDDKWQYIKTSKLVEDSLRLANQIPSDCSGIIGVARSGILPATVISTHLQLPLYTVHARDRLFIEEIKSQSLQRGLDYRTIKPKDGPKVIIDDTVHGGGSFGVIKSLAIENYKYAAVYVRPNKTSAVDYYVETLNSPHFLEWNMFNNSYVCGGPEYSPFYGGIAFDFDGILCKDPEAGVDRGDPNKWIMELQPTHIRPLHYKIPLIITNRLESWREPTVKWLNKYSINYDKIEMYQKSLDERDANFMQAVIEHKADKFKRSDCYLMVESDPQQAQLIHQYSQKPVLCPAEGKFYMTSFKS